MKKSIKSAVLAFVLGSMVAGGQVQASPEGIAKPIVKLMPHVKALRSELGLNEEQNKVLDAWIAEAPTKRKQVESEAKQLRSQLADAILNGSERITRETLKAQLAETETKLIEMSALCTRMLRKTLNDNQFAQVVDRYKASL